MGMESQKAVYNIKQFLIILDNKKLNIIALLSSVLFFMELSNLCCHIKEIIYGFNYQKVTDFFYNIC